MLMLGEAQGIVSLDTSQLDAGVARAMGSLSVLDGGGGVGRGLDRLESKLNGVGMSTTQLGIGMMGLGGALISPIAFGIKGMIDLEAQMDAVASALGTTSDAIGPLQDQIMQIGADGQYSANQIAAVTEELAKSGYTIDQIMGEATDGSQSMAKAVSDLASATGSDLATSVNAITTAMASWSPDVVGDRVDYRGVTVGLTDASKAADILTAAANASKADIADIQGGMKNFGATAASFGITFEDTAAAIALFTNYGVPGREAGTSLTRALVNLSKPTAEAATLMNELGISAFDMEGNFKGLPNLFGQLDTALSGTSDQYRQWALSTMFGADALDVMTLGMQSGTEGFAKMRDQMDDWGIASRQAAQRVDNLKGALERMWEGMLNFTMKLASGAIKPLTMLANGVDKVVEMLSKIPQPILSIIGLLISVMGLASLAGGAFLLMAPHVLSVYNNIRALSTLGGGLGTVASAVLRINGAMLTLLGTVLKLLPILGLGYLAYKSNFLGFGDWIDTQVSKATQAWERFKGLFADDSPGSGTAYGPDDTFKFRQIEGDGPDGFNYIITDENGREIGTQLESWWGEDGRIHAKVKLENGEIVEAVYNEDNKTLTIETEFVDSDGRDPMTRLERFNKGMDGMQDWAKKNGLGLFSPVLDGVQSVVNTGASWLSSARGVGQWYDRFRDAFDGTRGVPGMNLWERMRSAWNVSTMFMENDWIDRVDGFIAQTDFLMEHGVNPIDAGLQALGSQFPALAPAIGVARSALKRVLPVWEDANEAWDNFRTLWKGGGTAGDGTGGALPGLGFVGALRETFPLLDQGMTKVENFRDQVGYFTKSWKQNHELMGLIASTDPVGAQMSGWEKAIEATALTLEQFGFEGAARKVRDFGESAQMAFDRFMDSRFVTGIRRASNALREFIDNLDSWTLSLERPDIAGALQNAGNWFEEFSGLSFREQASTVRDWIITVGTPVVRGAAAVGSAILSFLGGAVAGIALTAWDIILGKPTVLFGWGGTGEDSETGLDTLLEDVFGGVVSFTVNAVLDLALAFLTDPAGNARNLALGALAAGLGIMAVTGGIAPFLVLASIAGMGLVAFGVFNAVKDYFREHPEVVTEIKLKIGKVWAELEELEHVGWIFSMLGTTFDWVSGAISGLWGLRQALIDIGGPFEWVVNRFERTIAAAGALNVLSKIGSGYFKGSSRNAFMWRHVLAGLWEVAKFPFRLIFKPMETMRGIFSRIAINEMAGFFDPDTMDMKYVFGRQGVEPIRGFRRVFAQSFKYAGKALWQFVRGPFEVFGKIETPLRSVSKRFDDLWKAVAQDDVWRDFKKNGKIVGRQLVVYKKEIGDLKATKIGTFFAALNEHMRRSRTPLRFLASGFTAVGNVASWLWESRLGRQIFGPQFRANLQTAKRALIQLENAPWKSLTGMMQRFRNFTGIGAQVYGPFLPGTQQKRFLFNLRMIRGQLATNLTRMSKQAFAQGNFMRSRVLGAYAYFFNGFQWRNRQFLSSMRQLHSILRPRYFGPKQVGAFRFVISTIVGTLRRAAPDISSALGTLRRTLANTSLGNFARTLFNPRQWGMIPVQLRYFASWVGNSLMRSMNNWFARSGGNTRVGMNIAGWINRMVTRTVRPGMGQGPMSRLMSSVFTVTRGLANRTARGLLRGIKWIVTPLTKGPYSQNNPIAMSLFPTLDGPLANWVRSLRDARMPRLQTPAWAKSFVQTFYRGLERTALPIARASAPRFARLLFFPLTSAFSSVTLPFRAFGAMFSRLGGIIRNFTTGPFQTFSNAVARALPYFNRFGAAGPRVAAGMILAGAATAIWKSNIFGIQDAYGGVFSAIGRGFSAVREGWKKDGAAGALQAVIDGVKTGLADLPGVAADILSSPAWSKTFSAAGMLAGLRMGGPMGLALGFMGPQIARLATHLVGAGSRIFRAWSEGGAAEGMRVFRVEALKAAIQTGQWLQNTGQGLTKFGNTLRQIPLIGAPLGSLFERLGESTGRLGQRVSKATDLYQRLRERGLSPTQALALTMGATFPGLVKLWGDLGDVWDSLSTSMQPTIAAVRNLWEEIKDLGGPLGDIWDSFGKLLDGDFEGFWKDFKQGIGDLIPELGDVGSALYRIGIVSMSRWRMMSGRLFGFLGDKFPKLRKEFDLLGRGTNNVLTGVSGLWRGMDRLFQGDLEGAMRWFSFGFGEIGEGLGQIGQGLWDMLQHVDWSAVGSTIAGWWDSLVGWFQGLPWGDIWDSISGAISSIPWGDLWQGFKDGLQGLWNWITGLDWGLIADELNELGGPFRLLGEAIDFVRGTWNKLEDAINSIRSAWEWARENIPFLKTPMEEVESAASGLKDTLWDVVAAMTALLVGAFIIGFAFGGFGGGLKAAGIAAGLALMPLRLIYSWALKPLAGLAWDKIVGGLKGLGEAAKGLGAGRLLRGGLWLTLLWAAIDGWNERKGPAGALRNWINDIQQVWRDFRDGKGIDWSKLFGLDDFKSDLMEGFIKDLERAKAIIDGINDGLRAMFRFLGIDGATEEEMQENRRRDVETRQMPEMAENIKMDMGAGLTWADLGFTTDGQGNVIMDYGGLSTTPLAPQDLYDYLTIEVGMEIDDTEFEAFLRDTFGIEVDIEPSSGSISKLSDNVRNALRNALGSDGVGSAIGRALDFAKGGQTPDVSGFMGAMPTPKGPGPIDFSGLFGTAPQPPSATQNLMAAIMRGWQQDVSTHAPKVVTAAQQPVLQVPNIFQQGFAPIGGTVATTMGQAAAGAISASSGMQAGVAANVTGIRGSVTNEFLAARIGAVGNADGMNAGVTGATSGMAGSVIGETAGMAAGAVGSAMVMGVGMTAGAFLGASGTEGGMSTATGSVSSHSGSWVGIVAAAGGGMFGAGFGAGYMAGMGVAAGLMAALGAVRAAAAAIIATVAAAMSAAGEMASPSRLMAREIGVPLAQGVAQGLMSHLARRDIIKASYGVVGRVDDGMRRAAQIASPSKRFSFHGLMSSLGVAEGMTGNTATRNLARSAGEVMDVLARGLQPEDTDIGWFRENADAWRARQERPNAALAQNRSSGGGTTIIDQSTHRVGGAKTFHIKSTDPEGIQREIIALMDASWGDT